MTDIVVIGGGIAGLTAAAHCAPLGHVTLLERERSLGFHASGRSAALYEPNYGKPSTTALSRASNDAFVASGTLSARGLLMVAKEHETAAFEKDSADMDLANISVQEACGMIPTLNADVITRAAHHAGAWDIDTDALLQQYHRKLQGHGGISHTNCAVTRISRVRTGWEISTTTQGVIGCKVLINAAGAWADEIARMARISPLGLVPHRRSMARVRAPDGQDVSAWPMLFGPGESWYAKPDAGALIVSPADEDPTDAHDAFANDLTLAEGIARYEGYVTAPVTRMLANWAGLRTFSRDRGLVLGRSGQDPAFVWCAGQGGYGFQTAPAAGQLVHDLIAGKPPAIDQAIVAALSPARFD